MHENEHEIYENNKGFEIDEMYEFARVVDAIDGYSDASM